MAQITRKSKVGLEFTQDQLLAGLRQLGGPIPQSTDPNISEAPQVKIEGARVMVEWGITETITV